MACPGSAHASETLFGVAQGGTKAALDHVSGRRGAIVLGVALVRTVAAPDFNGRSQGWLVGDGRGQANDGESGWQLAGHWRLGYTSRQRTGGGSCIWGSAATRSRCGTSSRELAIGGYCPAFRSTMRCYGSYAMAAVSDGQTVGVVGLRSGAQQCRSTNFASGHIKVPARESIQAPGVTAQVSVRMANRGNPHVSCPIHCEYYGPGLIPDLGSNYLRAACLFVSCKARVKTLRSRGFKSFSIGM